MNSIIDQMIGQAYDENKLLFSISGLTEQIKWKIIQKRKSGLSREIVYASDDGLLMVFLNLVKFENTEALSFSIRLTAINSLPYRLNNIKIADFSFAVENPDVSLWSCTGGFYQIEKEFPPPYLRDRISNIDIGSGKTISSDLTGRSSNSELPIWIALLNDSGGIWYGPEWSGCWEMNIRVNTNNAGISLLLPTMGFKLYQGEEVDLPPFIIGTYSGSLTEGSNALRRFIKDELTPTVEDQKIYPQVVFQGLDGVETYQDEAYLIKEAKLAAEMGSENFILDGGWNHAPLARRHTGDGKETDAYKPWIEYRGDWYSPPGRFPSGVDKFALHVKRLGMRFGFWCEPQVSEGTPDYLEYRDILLEDNVQNRSVPKLYFVDMGKKRGEDYFFDVVVRFIEEYHANFLWFDYNTDPRTLFWDHLEEPDRRGLMELKFYKGLYSFFERLLEKYPNLRIESCASGGRIIDFGVLKRSHSIWISDFSANFRMQHTDIDFCRNMRSSLSKFIPSGYIQNALFIPDEISTSKELYPLYNYLSHFAGSFQFGQGLLEWKEEDVKFSTFIISKFKTYRRYFNEDFYHLVPMPFDKKGWDGWQFNDPKDNSGVLILFRMSDCEESRFTVPFHSQGALSNYEFDIVLGNGSIEQHDTKLITGLSQKSEAMLIYYSKGVISHKYYGV